MRKFLRNNYLSIVGHLLKPGAGIHIINSHYVTKNISTKQDSNVFEGFLKHLNIYAKFISLEEATARILSGDLPKEKPMISFTFDDGYDECYHIMAPLLEKYNTRGAFFINANYIGSDEEYQTEFRKRVSAEGKKPMNWDQVVDLHKRGHLIGSHTLDHYNLALLDDKSLARQLLENKIVLEDKLRYSCDYFAWPYGQNQHFPDSALEKSSQLHKFIYSGTDYKFYFSRNKRVLNRRHIEPYWPANHMNYFLSVNKKW